MSSEEKFNKTENAEATENKSEKEFSMSEIDELLKESEKVSSNLDKISKDEIFKNVDFEDLRTAIDKPDNQFDEIAYAEAGFGKKYNNFFRKFDYFTSFSLNKEKYELSKSKDRERFGVLKSKDRGLLDKTKINENVAGKAIEIGQNNEQEKKDIEENILDVKDSEFQRETNKGFFVNEADGKIMKYVTSFRTEKGQIGAAGKMREMEISRLETVNGAELVGFKDSMERNAKNRESFLKLSESMSGEEKERVTSRLDEEERQTKEKIKEKEEKIYEETNKFREPLEGKLQETLEIENSLTRAFNFIKTGELNLNKQIKECESFIKEAQKLDLLGGVGGDVIKIFEDKKAVLDAQAKEFTEKKNIISSRLEVLKINKNEIEIALSRVNNIGKTKKEIAEGEERKRTQEILDSMTREERIKILSKINSEMAEMFPKGREKKEKTWDETRDEVWGLNNEQEIASLNKSGGKKIDIGKLFEHYNDVSEESEKEENQKIKKSERRIRTKAKILNEGSDIAIEFKKAEEARNKKKIAKQAGIKNKKTDENKETAKVVEKSFSKDEEIAKKIFTKKDIENIVTKELKKVGFMNNKKIVEKSRDGLIKHLIGAVENEILKSPEKVNEKFIKKEVDDWYKILTKNLNESGK